jgi:TPR repeat protein
MKTARYYKLTADQGLSEGQNYEEAAKYYKLAAMDGRTKSQFRDNSLLEKDLDVKQDGEKAAGYYRLAAEKSYHKAEEHLHPLQTDGL